MNRIEQRLLENPAIAELFANFSQMNREREKAAAKANPVANKLSHIFEKSTAYRYWRAGRDGLGREAWVLARADAVVIAATREEA